MNSANDITNPTRLLTTAERVVFGLMFLSGLVWSLVMYIPLMYVLGGLGAFLMGDWAEGGFAMLAVVLITTGMSLPLVSFIFVQRVFGSRPRLIFWAVSIVHHIAWLTFLDNAPLHDAPDLLVAFHHYSLLTAIIIFPLRACSLDLRREQVVAF